MKRLGLGGLMIILAMGFLYLAFEALIVPAHAGDDGSSKPSADCITEAGTVILSLLEKEQDRAILSQQLKISVMKLALDSMDHRTRTAEDLVKKAEADIEAKDVGKVRTKLTAVYNQLGLEDDLSTIHQKFDHKRYTFPKSQPKPWRARFVANELSAYVQAKALLQDDEIENKKPQKYAKGIRYNQVDASILWLQSMITDRMDEYAAKGVTDFKIGKATRNRQETAWKVAFLTGYMKGIPAMSRDQLKKEIADGKSRIAAFFEKSAEVLKTKLKDKCPDAFVSKAVCPTCSGSNESRDLINAEVIRQIMSRIKTDKKFLDDLFLKDLLKKADALEVGLDPSVESGQTPATGTTPSEPETPSTTPSTTPATETTTAPTTETSTPPAGGTTPATGVSVDPNPHTPATQTTSGSNGSYVKPNGDGSYTFTGVGLEKLAKDGQKMADGLLLPNTNGCMLYFTAKEVRGTLQPGTHYFATIVKAKRSGSRVDIVIIQNDQLGNLYAGNKYVTEGNGTVHFDPQGDPIPEVVSSLMQNRAPEVANLCGFAGK